MIRSTLRVRILRFIVWTGVVISAAMLVVTIAAAIDLPARSRPGAATRYGSGGSRDDDPLVGRPARPSTSSGCLLGAACPGDNTAGFTWGTFITPIATDPASLIYSATGTPQPASVGNANLRLASSGSPFRAQTPGLSDALIPTPVPTLSFSSVSFDGLPAGDYWVGVSCVKQDGQFVPQTERFWSLAITITAGTGNEYTYGLADVADTTTTTTSTTTTTTTVVEAATTTVSVTTSSVSSPETTIDGASVTTTDPGASTTTDPDGSSRPPRSRRWPCICLRVAAHPARPIRPPGPSLSRAHRQRR